MPNKSRTPQSNRTYDDTALARIEELVDEGLTARQIAHELEMSFYVVGNIITQNNFRDHEGKQYRVPPYDGWNFHQDNLTLARHL